MSDERRRRINQARSEMERLERFHPWAKDISYWQRWGMLEDELAKLVASPPDPDS